MKGKNTIRLEIPLQKVDQQGCTFLAFFSHIFCSIHLSSSSWFCRIKLSSGIFCVWSIKYLQVSYSSESKRKEIWALFNLHRKDVLAYDWVLHNLSGKILVSLNFKKIWSVVKQHWLIILLEWFNTISCLPFSTPGISALRPCYKLKKSRAKRLFLKIFYTLSIFISSLSKSQCPH